MKKIIMVTLILSAFSISAQDLKIVTPRIYLGETFERDIRIYGKPKDVEKQTKDVNGNIVASASSKFSLVKNQKVTYQKVRFIFFLYNSGKIIYKVPTKSFNSTFVPGDRKLIGTLKEDIKFTGILGSQPKDTSLLLLETPNGGGIWHGDKSNGIPKFPVIVADSEMGIVELRPGEGTCISYETALQSIENGDKFIIQYKADNLDGRYDFWKGSIISEPFFYIKK